MKLEVGTIFRAGLTWGIIAVILAILGSALAPILPRVGGLTLGTFALLFAGIHYAARSRGDFLVSALGGGLSGVLAGVLLVLIQLSGVINLPMPTGAPSDLLGALVAGFVAGVAGALGFKLINR